MPRNDFLDFSKGILILLVTIGHAIQYGVYGYTGFWDDPLFKAIYLFHMPLFMAVAGYLSYRGIAREPFARLTLQRSRSFLVPIFFWAILHKSLAFLALGSPEVADLPSAILDEALTFLWFLWALLAALVITSAVRLLFGRHFWPAYGVVVGVSHVIPDSVLPPLIGFMLPFFAIGYTVAETGLPSMSRSRRLVLLVITLPISIGAWFLWTERTYIYQSGMNLNWENVQDVGLRFFGGLAASVAALILMHALFRSLPAAITRVTLPLGRDSIYIYIIQGYAFLLVLRINKFLPWPEAGTLPGTAAAVATGILVAFLCWLAGFIVSRQPLAAALLFGRFRR